MILKLLSNTQMMWIKFIKILIVFDDMIADMLSNKKRNPIVTELFTRGRNLSISLVFITQSYFTVPKNIRLNSSQFCFENSKQTRTSTNCIQSFIRY